MATTKLAREQHDFEKYQKYLMLKTIQIIVQSRLGEKVKNKSKLRTPGSDWFSIYIQDLPEVHAEARKTLGACFPGIGQSLCIEISLTTADGDTLVLENWVLGMKEHRDPSVRISNGVYNRMGQLLKVLICVCRCTPAYKLSCRQGPDSYVMCYRVFIGEPSNGSLGEDYQENHVGSIVTPFGTITMKVSYRTKFTIESQQAARDFPFVLKSDHFKPDISPKHLRRRSSIDQNPLDDYMMPQAGHDRLVNGARRGSAANAVQAVSQPIDIRCNKRDPLVEKMRECAVSGFKKNEQNLTFEEQRKIGAFVSSSDEESSGMKGDFLIPEPPFLSLLQPQNANKSVKSCGSGDHRRREGNPATLVNGNANKVGVAYAINTMNNANNNPLGGAFDHNSNSSDVPLNKSEGGDSSTVDDFVLVELRPPFADCDSNEDLGVFFRECQSAPPLASFANQPTLAEQVNEITSQLAYLENSMQIFDEFVNSVCQAETLK